jgi:hypothetical protein
MWCLPLLKQMPQMPAVLMVQANMACTSLVGGACRGVLCIASPGCSGVCGLHHALVV